MPAEWRSNLGAFEGATIPAIKSGLIGAGETYVTEVKQRLEHGYTTGAFVTGNNVNQVARGEPEATADGWEIAVGSRQTDPAYPLFWEVGHINAFTRRFERVEVWVPTMMDLRERLAAIVAEEIRAVDGTL